MRRIAAAESACWALCRAITERNRRMKQMRRCAGLVVAVLVVAVTGLHRGLAQEEVTHVASLPHLTVYVTLSHDAEGALILDERFTTDDAYGHSVSCMNASDFEYVLRDSTGKIVRRVKDAPGFAPMMGGGGVPEGMASTPNPCPPFNGKLLRGVVEDIFPDVPQGRYHLELTLEPRGRTDHARLAPFAVNAPFVVKI